MLAQAACGVNLGAGRGGKRPWKGRVVRPRYVHLRPDDPGTLVPLRESSKPLHPVDSEELEAVLCHMGVLSSREPDTLSEECPDQKGPQRIQQRQAASAPSSTERASDSVLMDSFNRMMASAAEKKQMEGTESASPPASQNDQQEPLQRVVSDVEEDRTLLKSQDISTLRYAPSTRDGGLIEIEVNDLWTILKCCNELLGMHPPPDHKLRGRCRDLACDTTIRLRERYQ
ncbi:hypothetical protein QR680_018462 [Steinernema hermaphroditum]|uniref:Uncharacterized protein n=1 Tax=Steinernema hermaphroditum TaxID=289476 RepID=A0AA39HKD2_9BILA|nr:hypothetical protein QR680_018462 [Steinernema hermaphroditum]